MIALAVVAFFVRQAALCYWDMRASEEYVAGVLAAIDGAMDQAKEGRHAG